MKNIKLKVVLMFITLFMTQVLYSQTRQGGGMGGRSGGQGRGGRPSMDMSKMNFEESAGIIKYDVDKVFAEINLKDNDVKTKVAEAFLSYEDFLSQLSLSYPTNIKFLKEATTLLKVYMKDRERTKIKELVQEAKKHMLIITPLTKIFKETLNSELKNILSEKEMKCWSQYASSRTEGITQLGNKTPKKQ